MKKFSPEEQKKLDDFDSSMYGEPDTWGKTVDQYIGEKNKPKTTAELKREKLDQAYHDGFVKEENLDRSNLYLDKFKNPQTGEWMSTWNIIKSTAETPEEYRERFLDYDLQDLKKEQVRKNNKNGKFYDGWGIEQKNANRNWKIRKGVTQALKKAGVKDPMEIDRVMFAKDFDTYKKKRDKRTKPFETILDNLQEPIKETQKKPIEINRQNVSETLINVDDLLKQRMDELKRYNTVEPLVIPDIPEPVFPKENPGGIEAIKYKTAHLKPYPTFTAPAKTSTGLNYIMGVDDE